MMIELNNVEKWYNRGTVNEVHALHRINLAIEPNQVVCVHGPSGSGKSTLLAILAGIIGPTSGSAVVNGRKLARLPDRFLTIHRRDTVGFIFQRFQLIPELSVLDNVTLPLLPLGVKPAERNRRAMALLDLLSIGHRARFPAAEISGGEQQRVAIARAMINDPPIIIADEPTAHLDRALSLEFLSIIEEFKRGGKTIVMASHDPLVADSAVVDRCLPMRDGRLEGPLQPI
jgi:putative ABC transport system ATP-binding protein